MRYKSIISALTVLSITTTLSAQEKSVALEEVTVTSSLIPTAVNRTGRNIITLKGEDFAKLPVNSIDELLRYVPGIEVQSRGPMGAQSDFVVRGGTFQQVLVILDGLRINDPNSGHFTSYIPITPGQIERIEILKGAASAIFGSDAVGGVINIITKSFSAQQQSTKQLSGQLTTGAYGLFNGNAGGYYSNGKTSIDAGLLSNNASGQPQRGTKGFFHNNTFSASINQDLGEAWQLALRSSYDSRKFAAQNFYTTFLSDTANEKVTTSWNQLKLSHQGIKGKFSLQTGYKSVNDTYQFSEISSANKSNSSLLQTLLTYEYKIAAATTILGGVQLQNRAIDSNDRGNHSVKQQAAFVILQQHFAGLTLSPALRIDNDQRSGSELVPQINISYNIANVQFRGSAGKTIRQPDFTERYNNYNQVLVKSGRIGNPDLAAERSFSYEAGADWSLNKNLRLSGSLFQQRFSRLIDYVNTNYADMPRQSNLSPTGTYALAKNIADVTTSGAETDVQYHASLSSGQKIFATGGVVWLNSTSPGGTPSLYLSSHAKFLSNFTLGYSNKRFAVSVNGLYKRRATQTATALMTELSAHYFVINVKAEYFILPGSLSVFAQVDNLADEHYSDILGARMPTRWVMGGLKCRIF